MDDVEFFLPSEVARLVYGHLKTTNCDDLSAKFLNESPHLSECRELQKRNRTFKTDANGLCLKEILDQFLNMNKLRTVNKLVDDDQQFRDPVEALNYLLSNNLKDKIPRSETNIDNQASLGGYSSSSSEDLFSDFSLNVRTPDKPKLRRKVTKTPLEPVIELEKSIDQSSLEITPKQYKSTSKLSSEVIPRQSTRLRIKKALKNDRSCNSDSAKELRNINDECETPRKLGNPPYSDTKIKKPKTPISLLHSDSETESTKELICDIDTPSNSQNPATERVAHINGLFSPVPTPKKKTIKVMKPLRTLVPVVSSPEADTEKINCKRNRTTAMCTSSKSGEENKKSKLSSEPVNLQNDDNEGSRRLSEEGLFISDPTPTEKPRVRRKSSHVNPTIIEEKIVKNTQFLEQIAVNINNVMNSPYKKVNIDCTEELNGAIQKVVHETERQPVFDEVLQDLIGSLFPEEEPLNDFTADLNSQEQASEATNTNSLTDFAQMSTGSTQVPIPETNDDASLVNDPNTIIIELHEDEIASTNNYTMGTAPEKQLRESIPVVGDIRQYVSCSADLTSSPDRENNNATVINVFNKESGFFESCKVNGNDAENVVFSTNSVLYQFNDTLQGLSLSKPTEFQICAAAPQIPRLPRAEKFVKIAPKPNIAIQITENSIGRSNPVRKRRTRGGKRT